MSDDLAALHAIIRGRVQGVGFRFFVERRANALGLRGWVRNRGDGATVEVLAEGSRVNLEALVADLRRGPRFASVDAVDATWQKPSGAFEYFDIRG